MYTMKNFQNENFEKVMRNIMKMTPHEREMIN